MEYLTKWQIPAGEIQSAWLIVTASGDTASTASTLKAKPSLLVSVKSAVVC